MIIGFLGKGGSGKSTLSSNFIKFLAEKDQDNKVLAIDADHNMDLSYNLGKDELPSYVGQSLEAILKYCGLPDKANYRDIFEKNLEPVFQISPADHYTNQFSHPVNEQISLMAAGPHTDNILHDQSCSHTLITPLKVYLPFLQLGDKEWVIIDEKAGADGVGTGITTGFDYAIVCVEPTPHSVKAAGQIIELLKFYETPFIAVGNKIQEKSDLSIFQPLGKVEILFPFHQENDFTNQYNKMLDTITNSNPTSRKARSQKKFSRNQEFITKN